MDKKYEIQKVLVASTANVSATDMEEIHKDWENTEKTPILIIDPFRLK